MTDPATAPDPSEFPYPSVTMQPKGFVDDIDIAPDAFVASSAVLLGSVSIGSRSSVWYNCVLRGDVDKIVIGSESNIQDGTVVHANDDLPTIVGNCVTVGHQCLLHGCVIGNNVVIGMGAIVLDGAVVGDGALLAAGSVVREGAQIPPNTFWAGIPAKQKGEVSEEWKKRFDDNWKVYVNNTWAYLRKMK